MMQACLFVFFFHFNSSFFFFFNFNSISSIILINDYDNLAARNLNWGLLQNDWEVVKRGWDAQVLGEAPYKFRSAVEAVKKLREEPKANDQYLPPFVIVDENGKPVGPIVDGDAVVTFNFRADRMTMISKALEYESFDKFDRVRFPKIRFAGMLQYDGELKLPSHYLVSPPEIERTSGEYLVHNGVRTFACRLAATKFICHSFLLFIQ